ncbi:MAG: uracil-DNA glycosylase [Oscillospiraceae bacterium]|nr:uracil-DNA glycosylase [Oscillospiraceae bacterium]
MTLTELREKCLECAKCELHKTRTTVVFGVGNENADIMFVGEGPGQREDETGEPFVGRSGQLLTHYLGAVGLERDEVYIANIVKCRPPGNRDPKPEEQELCLGWLNLQFELINPLLIVCLGRIAAGVLISPGFMVTKQHGVFFKKDERRIMGTFHPSALLRNPSLKPEAFGDFKALKMTLDELKPR